MTEGRTHAEPTVTREKCSTLPGCWSKVLYPSNEQTTQGHDRAVYQLVLFITVFAWITRSFKRRRQMFPTHELWPNIVFASLTVSFILKDIYCRSIQKQSHAPPWWTDACNTPSGSVSVSQWLSLGPRLCTAMCVQRDLSVSTSLSLSGPLTRLSARHWSDRWLWYQPPAFSVFGYSRAGGS